MSLQPEFSRRFWVVIVLCAVLLIGGLVVAGQMVQDDFIKPCNLTEEEAKAGMGCL